MAISEAEIIVLNNENKYQYCIKASSWNETIKPKVV